MILRTSNVVIQDDLFLIIHMSKAVTLVKVLATSKFRFRLSNSKSGRGVSRIEGANPTGVHRTGTRSEDIIVFVANDHVVVFDVHVQTSLSPSRQSLHSQVRVTVAVHSCRQVSMFHRLFVLYHTKWNNAQRDSRDAGSWFRVRAVIIVGGGSCLGRNPGDPFSCD